ncbi:NAD(P)H-binding protein [Patulibacter sp. NPDC049589]|uniref:NAD(P)H-binding protein n=1 Tax=Patulibacter sp. NPDC049589 TaxID=3154731 RepID=UPI00343EEAB3
MSDLVLVTGASGFIGSQLIERLAGPEVRLRALVRDASRLHPPDGVELDVVEADLSDAESLVPALHGVDVAYYLVHSMGGSGDLEQQDREAAENYLRAARAAGVRRTVYLGAVGFDPEGGSSDHLRSRHEVEELLADGTPEVVVVRASMVVGVGSGSFKTLVQMVDRLPVLATAPWREARSQPIAVDDVLDCLAAARTAPPGRYEIAGADELSVEELMREIARQLDKPYRALSVPISVPKLEGLVASAVADEDRALITALLEGLGDDLVVDRNDAEPVFGVTPLGFSEAAARAIPRIVAADD